jgi:hypothetical protein
MSLTAVTLFSQTTVTKVSQQSHESDNSHISLTTVKSVLQQSNESYNSQMSLTTVTVK